MIKLEMETHSVYHLNALTEFRELKDALARELLDAIPTMGGTWQQLDVSQSALHATYELENVSIHFPRPTNLQSNLRPDLPWVEDHFQERVGGLPVNPGKTHWYWPHHGRAEQEKLHMRGDIYDHNYMERYWPKPLLTGYRFKVGDLGDVVQQLRNDPTTRQAYLPVWFPEDTGAQQKQRVPCSLGYHFMIRDGRLSCNYYLRSCEIYRHFTNDVYLTMRLMQWMADRVGCGTGALHMHISSLHGFVGDTEKIQEMTQ